MAQFPPVGSKRPRSPSLALQDELDLDRSLEGFGQREASSPHEAGQRRMSTEESIEQAIVQALEEGDTQSSIDLITGAKLSSLETCTGASTLIEALESGECPKLITLRLGNEALSDEDGAAKRLADLLRNNTSLKALHLDDCCAPSEDLNSIAAALGQNTGLHRLSIDSSHAEGERATWLQVLAESLQSNKSIECLELEGMDLDPDGVAALVGSLSKSSLHHVSLCGGQRDAQLPFAEALTSGLSMTSVGLLSPVLSDRSTFRGLVHGLLSQGGVRRLELDAWLFQPEYLPDLCDALRQGGTVLELCEFGKGPVQQPEIRSLLASHEALRAAAAFCAFCDTLQKPLSAFVIAGDSVSLFPRTQTEGLRGVNQLAWTATRDPRKTLREHKIEGRYTAY